MVRYEYVQKDDPWLPHEPDDDVEESHRCSIRRTASDLARPRFGVRYLQTAGAGMTRLDDTNLAILKALQRDARITVAELARNVGRSETAVRERIAALESEGYLRGYQAMVNLDLVGFHAYATVRADFDGSRLDELGERLSRIPNVISARQMTGERPLLIAVLARDMDELDVVLQEKILPLGLRNAKVDVALRTLVEPRPPQLVRVDTDGGTARSAAERTVRALRQAATETP